ncbi:MAG: hypothetical protein M1837_006421 [Sclerophora amabilis]|nr:MAG: hypothetical protein M1837_006421 [Sclerophora amabilis]
MSSDDQYFLDTLSSIPNDVRRYSAEVADTIDRQFDMIAKSIRETLSSTTWIPESARPILSRQTVTPPPPPVHSTLYERAQDWAVRHKEILALIAVSATATGILVYRRRRKYNKKRRARRASNGARKEVIVIAGPPHEPVLRTLALDLERRGFIIYVVANNSEDERHIHNESRADIRPLLIETFDSTISQGAIDQFNKFLLSPQHAFPGAAPHTLNLVGFILIPDNLYPSGPVETLAPEIWSDALNAKVLAPIAITQAFLRTICDFKPRVLVLTPSIVPSLTPPFHSIESSVVAALGAFTTSLARELGTMAIDVCHFKLGTFDYGGLGRNHHQHSNKLQAINGPRADVLSWPATARAAYAKNYFTLSASSATATTNINRNNKGSSFRELHNSVFDALTDDGRPPRVWHVGSGSLVYDIVGAWVPAGIVGWMLGIRQVEPSAMPAPSSSSSSSASSPPASASASRAPQNDDDGETARFGEVSETSMHLPGWEKVEGGAR